MKNLVTIYRWEDGKILTDECSKSEVKYRLGWRLDPQESMLSQLGIKRYNLTNSLYKACEDIEMLNKLTNDLNEICEVEDSNEGLKRNIDRLISLLEGLK